MQDMNAAVALRAARRQSGLTLRGLAERAGTSHSTLAAYEAGRVTPTVDTFDRIVRAAGYAVDATLTPRVARRRAAVTRRRARAGPRAGLDVPGPARRRAAVPARSGLRPSRPGGGDQPPAKILALDAALDEAGYPHAFGGALALAWCTQRARGTIDIDVNVFVGVDERVTCSMRSPPVSRGPTPISRRSQRDGQVRLWWDSTPVDVFLNTTDFHAQAAARAIREQFAGAEVPFLSCADLAVFKAFFNRTKDWADLEEMIDAGTLDLDRVLGVLVRYLGADDERITRLRALAG